MPTDLQAMLKNAPAGDKPEGGGAMDALKAALAALQSGKGTNPPEAARICRLTGLPSVRNCRKGSRCC